MAGVINRRSTFSYYRSCYPRCTPLIASYCNLCEQAPILGLAGTPLSPSDTYRERAPSLTQGVTHSGRHFSADVL